MAHEERVSGLSGMDTKDNPVNLERIDRLNAEAWEYRYADLQRCLRISQRALEVAEEARYARGRAYALRNLGYCAYARSDFEEALGLLSQAVEMGRDLNDDTLARDGLSFTAAVYTSLGDHETALGFVEETFSFNTHLGDVPALVYSLMHMGVIYHHLGRFQESLPPLLGALERSREINDEGSEAAILTNLRASYIGLERTEEAVEALQQAFDLTERLGLTERKTVTLVNLGEALGMLGRYDEALEVLDRARLLIGPDGPREGMVYTLLNEGAVHLRCGDPKRALETLERGLNEAQTLGSKTLSFQMHERLAQTHKDLGNHALALRHFEHFHSLEREVRDQQTERRLRAFTAQHEIEKARAEAEIERLRNVELARALEALETKSRELELLVIQDPLTGLYNRRYLEQVLELEYAKAKESGWPLPVAVLDVEAGW